MLFRFLTYIKFLLKSTNHHGVHSPFIFNYVIKCLYSKPKRARSKTRNVLLKTTMFFNKDGASILANETIKEEIQSNLQGNLAETPPFDMVYLERPDKQKIREILQKEQLQNSGVIVIDSINQNAENKIIWEEIVSASEITASLDLFYCGVLFIRNEQAKEHFTIRI